MNNQAAQTMPELPKSDQWGFEQQSWLYTDDQMHQYARDYAASQTAGVPDGYALVPVEPTLGMLEALSMFLHDDLRLMGRREQFLEGYAAMLAAAPAASGGEVSFRSCTCHTENDKRLCMNKRECVVVTAQSDSKPPAGASVGTRLIPVSWAEGDQIKTVQMTERELNAGLSRREDDEMPLANPASREIGWLIEHADASPPMWFLGHSDISGESEWTHDASSAIRFSRKQDAEQALRTMVPRTYFAQHFTSEHVWMTQNSKEDFTDQQNPNPPAAASQSSNPNPVTPGLSSESGASVSERAWDRVAYTLNNMKGFFGRDSEQWAALDDAARALSSPRQEGEVVAEVVYDLGWNPRLIWHSTWALQNPPPSGTKLYTHPSTAASTQGDDNG